MPVAWTPPHILAFFPPGPATEESSSFATVMRRAVVLTEVLQPSHVGSEPLFSINEAFSDILLGVWATPCTGAPVSRPIARSHCPAPRDPAYLANHPTSESLVVQALVA